MLSYPSGMHPMGLWHLFLRGPRFEPESAQLSRIIPCDMAVTSAPQAMPPQHLWDPKQRVHISRWHYKREDAHVGSFLMLVGYFLTIFSKSVVIVSFLCCITISFDCSPSCCGFDHVVLCLADCGYLFRFISSKLIGLENLNYNKQQQEQAGASTIQNNQSIQQ